MLKNTGQLKMYSVTFQFQYTDEIDNKWEKYNK